MQYHMPSDNLPNGDLFVIAKNKEQAKEFFIKYIISQIKIEDINKLPKNEGYPEETYGFLSGKVLEEH